MVLDAGRERGYRHREILEAELHSVGLRLNQNPPDIYFRRKPGGGIKYSSTVQLTKLGSDPARVVRNILHEYRIHNCEILLREDVTSDQIIDTIEGNRKYVRCLYVYNKIDICTIEYADELARRPNSVVISCNLELGLDYLLQKIWESLELVRVYTKKKGMLPDFDDPIILTKGRGGCTVESACEQIHKEIVDNLKFAKVWGTSAKHNPQRVGVRHGLEDEDVVEFVLKTASEQRKDKNWGAKVQQYYDSYHEKKKKKKGKN
eukprot:TRINITY_DN189_c0_g1_i2.p1 TRINITY_DN189_c0_g1~~TRINITY_DN189_c0_g1_i2.p1  ORF type:complete len:262 (-),score=64.30 TRINITY_DN189_c0_g1_i2:119-904(-)